MRKQFGNRKNSWHKKYHLGAHPIIQHFIEKLQIPVIIGDYVKQDKRLLIGVEKMISIFIHNILTGRKPMYELADWLTPIDANVFGLTESDITLVTDDRAAKTLDSFYFSNHNQVFLRVALRAIKIFELDCSIIHQDTTTVTFSGRYETQSAAEILTYGHNKDHRPDLKQLVLGLNITEDGGVPLLHKIYSGNQTDDKLHPENHQKLRKLLGRCDFIYVADCKLATAKNLAKIVFYGGRFVSVMPRTWKEDFDFRNLVKQNKVNWQPLLSKSNNRKPDSKTDKYFIAEGEYKTSTGFTILWIKSTQKAEQDVETRTRHIENASDQLRELQTRLNKHKLKDIKQIKIAVDKILKQTQCEDFIATEVFSQIETEINYKGRGRPSAKTKGTKSQTTLYSIGFSIQEKMVEFAQQTDGIFPLITNIADQYSPKRILEIYKFQPFLEKRHSQLKKYQQIAPIYTKKTHRVVALLHMHVLSLTVATLIERQLRKAMKREKINSLEIYPGSLPCKYPTMFDLVRLFKNVEKYEVQIDGNIIPFPAELNPMQKTVLKYLEVPESLY